MNQEVRIIRLEPLRVVSGSGFGSEPEGIAWGKILSYATTRGIDIKRRRFLGFNNPDPTPGSPNYGYEQWMTLEPGEVAEGDVQLKEYPGGLYAVARCIGPANLPQAWQELVAWAEDSPHPIAHHQYLEEVLNPEILTALGEIDYDKLEFAIYLPIAS